MENKLDRISERVYNASFILTVILILGATIGTAIVRYLTGSPIELVPDNVFRFIEHVLWIFAIPQSIKIIGDKLPLVVQALQAARGYNNYEPNNTTGVGLDSRVQSPIFGNGGSSEPPHKENTYW